MTGIYYRVTLSSTDQDPERNSSASDCKHTAFSILEPKTLHQMRNPPLASLSSTQACSLQHKRQWDIHENSIDCLQAKPSTLNRRTQILIIGPGSHHGFGLVQTNDVRGSDGRSQDRSSLNQISDKANDNVENVTKTS